MTVTISNVPDAVMDRLRSVAETTRRPVEEEIVRVLADWADRPGRERLPLAPPTVTDEGPAPGPIPLHGPGRVLDPIPGGRLMPSLPIFLDERGTE